MQKFNIGDKVRVRFHTQEEKNNYWPLREWVFGEMCNMQGKVYVITDYHAETESWDEGYTLDDMFSFNPDSLIAVEEEKQSSEDEPEVHAIFIRTAKLPGSSKYDYGVQLPDGHIFWTISREKAIRIAKVLKM